MSSVSVVALPNANLGRGLAYRITVCVGVASMLFWQARELRHMPQAQTELFDAQAGTSRAQPHAASGG